MDPPGGQMKKYVSGRAFAVRGSGCHAAAVLFEAAVGGASPAGRGRVLVLGLCGVLLRPGAQQDGVPAARLGHHELREALRTRVHRQTVHLRRAAPRRSVAMMEHIYKQN